MQLATFASHRAASPVLLAELVARALAATPGSGARRLAHALLRNPSLRARDTAAFLEGPFAAGALDALAHRPGLDAAALTVFLAPIRTAHLRAAYSDGLPDVARRTLADALAQRTLANPPDCGDWWSELLSTNVLDPATQLAALTQLTAQPSSIMSEPRITVYAALHHPDGLAALSAACTTGNPALSRLLKDAAVLAGLAQRAGRDPVHVWLEQTADRLHDTEDVVDLLRHIPDPHLATYLLARKPDAQALRAILKGGPFTPSVRAAALTAWQHTPFHATRQPTPFTDILDASDFGYLNAFFAAALTPTELLSAFACATLRPSHLDKVMSFNARVSAKDSRAASFCEAGAWLATHPNATPKQRARGLSLAQTQPLTAQMAAAGVAHDGGLLPAGALVGERAPADFDVHAHDLAATYLTGALGAIDTPARTQALLALAPEFTGTLRELLTTALSVAD
jgi:hypothetical protein